MKILFSRGTCVAMVAVVAVTTIAYTQNAFGSRYSYKERAMPAPVEMSKRLQDLFAKTKLVCFGRYAMEVPVEAQIVYGAVGDVDVYEGGLDRMKEIANSALVKVKFENPTMEVVYKGIGPIDDSWQSRYFANKWAKESGRVMYETYVQKGIHVFSRGDIVEHGEKGDSKAAERQRAFAQLLRLRADDEAPRDPGSCIPHAFVSDANYAVQEMDHAGLFIPSLPDVSFSISSNKNAYADYQKEEYETKWRKELSLIYRINQAKKDQPFSYPQHTLLREGKRDVHHWHGEESLIKRKDGGHDFEWALVGTPGDVANPSEFNVKMYTKMAHDVVGAAPEASLSDDEAVALFDKLLTGLKFRVQVPGAPVGSFYFPAAAAPAPAPLRDK